MIRLTLPALPMQNALIAWPFCSARGMSSRTRRQSAAVSAWVTILTIAGASAMHSASFASQEFGGGRPGEVVPGDDQFCGSAGERGAEFRLQCGVGRRFDIHVVGSEARGFPKDRDPFRLRPGEIPALFPAPVRDDHRAAPCLEQSLQVGVGDPVDPELDAIGQGCGPLHPLDGRSGRRGGDGDADHGSSSPRG